MRLSATKVKALCNPGRYSDGEGLHLFIGKTGKKSWVQRITIDRRRRDIGLGGYPAVSLAQARKRATDNRAAVVNGEDPLADKRKPEMPTLKEATAAVYVANRPRWRNEKHAVSWLQTLERHALPKLGRKRIDEIGRAEVLSVLTTIWTTRPETARRVRQRLRTIFRWAMAHGFIENNPAGEMIDGALPSMPKVKAHFRAMPMKKSVQPWRRSMRLKPLRLQTLPVVSSPHVCSLRRSPGRQMGRDRLRRPSMADTISADESGLGAPRAAQHPGG